jgi:hypothetical protein
MDCFAGTGTQDTTRSDGNVKTENLADGIYSKLIRNETDSFILCYIPRQSWLSYRGDREDCPGEEDIDQGMRFDRDIFCC